MRARKMGYILFHCCVLLLRTWLTESTIIHKHRLLPRETRFWAEARLCSTALSLPWPYAACLGDDCYPCFRCTLKIPVHEGWSSGCSGLAAWMKKMSTFVHAPLVRCCNSSCASSSREERNSVAIVHSHGSDSSSPISIHQLAA